MKTRPTPRTDQNEEGIRHFERWGFENSAYPPTYEWTTFARHLERELAESREECEEQARLLGMSGDREAALLAKVERLERDLEILKR